VENAASNTAMVILVCRRVVSSYGIFSGPIFISMCVILELAQEVESLLAGKGASSSLKVGATLTIGNYLAVGIMAKMMQQNKDAEVNLSVANTSEITAKVLNFELDIGLIEGEVQHPDLEVIEWCDDQLMVFCAPTHPLVNVAALNDKQLKQTPWILRETGSGTRQAFDRDMHGLFQPNYCPRAATY